MVEAVVVEAVLVEAVSVEAVLAPVVGLGNVDVVIAIIVNGHSCEISVATLAAAVRVVVEGTYGVMDFDVDHVDALEKAVSLGQGCSGCSGGGSHVSNFYLG
ncbi:unnamed protein product, partial [Meganyctiphanes norvegica]